MCQDHSPLAPLPAVLHEVEVRQPIRLEPVDSVTVTTLMDNVSDMLMPESGTRQAAGPGGPGTPRSRPRRWNTGRCPTPWWPSTASPPWSRWSRTAREHRFCFSTPGTSPDGVVENMRRLPDRSDLHRGDRLQPRALRPHGRPGRADPGAGRPGESAGADPSALLAAPPARAARHRAPGDPHHESPRSRRRRIHGDRGPGSPASCSRDRC